MLKRAYRNTISAFQSRSNDRSQRRETDPSNEYKESGQQEDDYKQPLELDKALYRYHKERHTPLATSTTLEQQQQSHQLFLPLLPYELLVQIFKKLELNDLFCCAVVSKSWCDFMANWPTFWQILSCELPHINKNNLNALLRREAKEFKLDGPVSLELLHHILFLLSCSSHNQHIHTLHFNNITFTSDSIDLLTYALSSTSPPVKQSTFMDCRIPQDKIASHLLNTCSNMEHVSFSHGSTPLDVVEYIQLPTKQDFYTSDIKCWSLTYLKLSFTYYTNNDQLTDHDCIHNEQLGRLLSQCPNLKHLFMDSGGTIHHGNCLDQILKHCHRLETLVISPNADFPSDCSDNKHITSTTQRPGLRQLVLSGKHLRITNTDMISVYKQHYETLEMIYLYFHSIDEITRSLVKLAHTKAPRLQQLYLLTDNNFIPISIHKLGYPSINKALVTLLSGGCPLLNTIHIINNDFDYSMPESKYNGDNYFSISDKVLKAIATGCRELHTLKFPGPRRYTKKGLMHFATTGVKKLVELEMDIIPEHILEVVIRIESLQKLIFSGSNTSLPDDIQNALSEILQKRIGIASHLTE